MWEDECHSTSRQKAKPKALRFGKSNKINSKVMKSHSYSDLFTSVRMACPRLIERRPFVFFTSKEIFFNKIVDIFLS
jgi:hypothetical protein